MPSEMYKNSVQLMGSLPLSNPMEVFELVGKELATFATRLPDGEAAGWLNVPFATLDQTAGLERDPDAIPDPRIPHISMPKWRVKAGTNPNDLKFLPLHYSATAKKSYELFQEFRAAGKIAAGTRFQVTFPTPFAVVGMGISPRDAKAVLPAFEKHLFSYVREVCTAVPHDDLAIQWDVCIELVEILEKQQPVLSKEFTFDEVVAMLVRASTHVPPDVHLGYHFCYGNPGGKHIVEPKDTRVMVTLANALFREIGRSIEWVHMPVPIDRDDADYFAPLADLKLPTGTKVFLGLVHIKDGIEGAKRRIDAAKVVVRDFGVANECGLRFFPRESLTGLFALYRAAAQAVHDKPIPG